MYQAAYRQKFSYEGSQKAIDHNNAKRFHKTSEDNLETEIYQHVKKPYEQVQSYGVL